ncbi:hypothetical protein DV735_g4216, partial [Chaetothyriales sp. CBS 134920]
MRLFLRQIWTLTAKNLLLVLVRHWFSTPLRAFVLPCIFVAFLSVDPGYARNLFIPPSVYGIGDPVSVRTLSDALHHVSGGRDQLVFVNNGLTGGAIDAVIEDVIQQAGSFSGSIRTLTEEVDLLTQCRNSIRGTSRCIAGAVFFSSPDEGPDGRWNYTIRADGALQTKIVVDSHSNDAEIYLLPLQHAIDRAISKVSNNGTQLPEEVKEYIYTSMTAKERRARIRVRYMGGIIDILGIAFFIGIVGVTYQLTGVIATERELGMAQLLDSMMPNRKRWQPQMARIIANHLAFDILYGPGWLLSGIILSFGVFDKTSAAIVIIFNLLAGLAMSSMSILGGAFFHKAQLSGITSVIASLLLAIIAQVASKAGTASVAILSLLFPPMNYVYFIIFMARWERQDLGANLVQSAPKNTSALPGIAMWVFSILHIIVFPILGAWVERTLYGTASKERSCSVANDSEPALSLKGFTKRYPASLQKRVWSFLTRKPAPTTLAVDDLSLDVPRGSLQILLGANGSGKSTTLDAVAGLSSTSSGTIALRYADEGAGLGLCPQKNVLWDELTVEEHVRIFNKIKSVELASKEEIRSLIAACDIPHKASARSKTLSGGQKRKLQLAMMFTGGSSVCCIDEVSSGLDPISRRKIWDILLAERGKRTIVLTTHFLDEADLLADHIAILSRGKLKASGTSVELKHSFGSGYRVHVYHNHDELSTPIYSDVAHSTTNDQAIYTLPTSAQTAAFLERLEADGVIDYQVSGPTIEDVFLKVAEEVAAPESSSLLQVEDHSLPNSRDDQKCLEPSGAVVKTVNAEVPQLLTGRRIGIVQQIRVLFRKRWTIFLRNPLPYLAALFTPIIAAGLVTLFLKNFEQAGCDPLDAVSISDTISLSTQLEYDLVAGPRSRISEAAVEAYVASFGFDSAAGSNITQLSQSLHLVDTLDEFNEYIKGHFHNVTPGGLFLGDGSSPVTFAWKGNDGLSLASITQNALDNLLSGIPISTQYQAFDIPWASGTGKSLQLITYFGLAMAVYPSFFALYPTVERLRKVRGLHYSNGIRSMPLWLAYTLFDFVIVLVTSAVAIIIFAVTSNDWYNVGYLFVVFFLYGLASTLLSYLISLLARSQLSAFAFAAGGQAVMFLLYFIAFMSVLTYCPPDKIDSYLKICHFTIAIISPVANLTRSMLVGLNVFSIACSGNHLLSYPGALTGYGGPILYLVLQSLFLFGLLLLWDSGSIMKRLRSRQVSTDVEEKDTTDADISNELVRVTSSRDGLRVLQVSKRFGKNVAVSNVTFGVPRDECLALLGPNGAGKSTLISMIRGDIQPSDRNGDILVDDISVVRHRAHARARLGVCPQFDAIDKMTVREHLDLYARARGVSDPSHNVNAVIHAVGLDLYADRLAEKLSGGNKRKLSLGIALMGNPTVLLLDEPSSGMDAASKRIMWRTLESVMPTRSIVLTTHSMEEADALASRACIIASKMLALGTTDALRRRHGNAYHVHLVHHAAPHSSPAAMHAMRAWVATSFPTAIIEPRVYAGQLRFSLPLGVEGDDEGDDIIRNGLKQNSTVKAVTTTVGEEEEDDDDRGIGIAHYSVSRATLDQVFLDIVGKHNVEEEEGSGGTTRNSSSAG